MLLNGAYGEIILKHNTPFYVISDLYVITLFNYQFKGVELDYQLSKSFDLSNKKGTDWVKITEVFIDIYNEFIYRKEKRLVHGCLFNINIIIYFL